MVFQAQNRHSQKSKPCLQQDCFGPYIDNIIATSIIILLWCIIKIVVQASVVKIENSLRYVVLKFVEFSTILELYLDKHVPEVDGRPSPLTFYRDFVAPNKPAVFNNAINQWPALKHWGSKYLRYENNFVYTVYKKA